MVCANHYRSASRPTKRLAFSEIDPNMDYDEDLVDLKELQQEREMISKLRAERQWPQYRPFSDMIRAQHFKHLHPEALMVLESLSREGYRALIRLSEGFL